ncbi:protein-L-isoaspartate O-methyltransferase family protein [Jannaschia donghaensis]|uniref:protein-L-isoaspartate O-methyltransferase family protein n=1 Tax=Jannaschia donghaensis TaxID=420998 RepID=UPI0027B8AE18|nr:protein-L-isoaspartate O-methyltransferase [Jannaschia donghaensis]
MTKFPIISAMLDIPREAFVPGPAQPVAYMDAPVNLGSGREMMEARVLAKMLDALDIQRTDQVLVIGGGLGYSAAVLAHMADSVVMVEEEADLASEAEATLTQHEIDNAVVLQGALVDGAAKAGLFDVIVIEGAVETVPETLTSQLAEGGRISAVFADGANGEVRVGTLIEGHLGWRYAFNATAPVLPGFSKSRGFVL